MDKIKASFHMKVVILRRTSNRVEVCVFDDEDVRIVFRYAL